MDAGTPSDSFLFGGHKHIYRIMAPEPFSKSTVGAGWSTHAYHYFSRPRRFEHARPTVREHVIEDWKSRHVQLLLFVAEQDFGQHIFSTRTR